MIINIIFKILSHNNLDITDEILVEFDMNIDNYFIFNEA